MKRLLHLLGAPVLALALWPGWPSAAAQPGLPQPAPADPAATAAPASLPTADIDALIGRMSLEDQVGQLLMVGFKGTNVTHEVATQLRTRAPGGVCLFKRNLRNAEQTARLTRAVRALFEGHVAPFIAIDQEGGNVVRIADKVAVLPGNMALGATRSRRLAYEAGRVQAIDLKLLGFNMNLAPVLDVNVNPKNPVIGVRSFGDRSGLVAEFGTEFVRGQQAWGVVTVAKHFPGHGATTVDSHKAMPERDVSLDEIVNGDLAPFRAVIDIGLDGMMSSHVAWPKLSLGIEEPATVSPAIIAGLLRGRLGFKGLVLTDELEMEAIAKRYPPGLAAVMAVRAGADMVLVPWRPERQEEVFAALLDAARREEITPERLRGALRHILVLKRGRGVLDEAPPPLARALETLEEPERQGIVTEIARSSLTLLRAPPGAFPVPDIAKRRVAVISVQPRLTRALRERAAQVLSLRLPLKVRKAAAPSLADEARSLAERAEVVVLAVADPTHLDVARAALAAGRPAVVAVLGSPYLADALPTSAAILLTYSTQDVSALAAAAAISGETGTPGRLPVRLSSFPFGHGIEVATSKDSPTTGTSGFAAARAAGQP